jgi:hypothetical protein
MPQPLDADCKAMVKDQKQHWEEAYSKNQEFFGEEPSVFAKQALDLIRENGVSELLELGPGQGRDTMFVFCRKLP